MAETSSPPPWLPLVSEDPERARIAALSPGERLEIFVELCALNEAILMDRPDRQVILRDRARRSPEAERQWLELLTRHRDA